MSDDIIRKALGIPATESPDSKGEIVPLDEETSVDAFDSALEQDFDFVIDNLKGLIAQGQDAINELMLIAKQSQHPRAFEVIATLLKATADMNNDILTAHKKKTDMRPNAPQRGAKVTNNNLFVGSTAELQTMLEQLKEKNNE